MREENYLEAEVKRVLSAPYAAVAERDRLRDLLREAQRIIVAIDESHSVVCGNVLHKLNCDCLGDDIELARARIREAIGEGKK